MKPPPFEYHVPDSLEQALSLKAEHGDDAKVLAGGQSLVPAMNFRVASPERLIDLNPLTELDYIERDEDGALRIGAMTRQTRVEHDPIVAGVSPLLHETMPFIAHPQIRNRGTIGGSIVHADPAAELPVIALATNAQFKATKSDGERWIEAADFFFGYFMTELAADEILTEVRIPAMPERTGWSFMEAARRRGDYAMMGLAALVTLDESGTCQSARLVYLNAGDGPVDAPEAAALLVGQSGSVEAFEAAANKAASDEMEPMGNVHATPEYQRHLARVLTGRALTTAFERAGA